MKCYEIAKIQHKCKCNFENHRKCLQINKIRQNLDRYKKSNKIIHSNTDFFEDGLLITNANKVYKETFFYP